MKYEDKGRKNKLIIVGAGGHGKVIADIAVQNGYREIVFLDDSEEITECSGYPVVGKSSDVEKLAVDIRSDVIVGIGDAGTRKRIQASLKNVNLVTLVHPDAVIAQDVVIGAGTIVMAGAVVNPGVRIGEGCIINTCSSVDHDCKIGDYVHIAVGSHLCGMVTVGDGTWIGAGATVSNDILICPNCVVGAGTVIVRNIEEMGTYIGVPAKKIKKNRKLLTWGGVELCCTKKKKAAFCLRAA